MVIEIDEQRAVDLAKQAGSLFERGAEVVYLATKGPELVVESAFPAYPSVVVTARSLREVERYLRGLQSQNG